MSSIELQLGTLVAKIDGINDKFVGFEKKIDEIKSDAKEQKDRLNMIEAFINQIKGGWFATVLLASICGTLAGVIGTFVMKYFHI